MALYFRFEGSLYGSIILSNWGQYGGQKYGTFALAPASWHLHLGARNMAPVRALTGPDKWRQGQEYGTERHETGTGRQKYGAGFGGYK